MRSWVCESNNATAVRDAVNCWTLAEERDDPVDRMDWLMRAFENLVRGRYSGLNDDIGRRNLLREVAEVLDATEVRQLVEFDPLIRDPRERDERRMTECHLKARSAWARMQRYRGRTTASSSAPERDEASDAVCKLIWLVRSNIDHGRKRARMRAEAPLPQRRDQAVASLASAVVEAYLAAILGPLEDAKRIPGPPQQPPAQRLP